MWLLYTYVNLGVGWERTCGAWMLVKDRSKSFICSQLSRSLCLGWRKEVS